jgi:soluble lytic murein transglycosylase-like protein
VIRILALGCACAAAWGQSSESIEAQKRSVALQREIVARYHAPEPADVPADPVCEPLAEETVGPMIDAAAQSQQLPAKLIRAVAARESGFRPCAVSKKGAKGVMQLLPETAEQLGVDDPFEPEANVEAGAKFLRQLLDKFKGDLTLSLAAYNAGPAAVEEIQAVPDIPETREYVKAVVDEVGLKRIDLPSAPKPKPTGN